MKCETSTIEGSQEMENAYAYTYVCGYVCMPLSVGYCHWYIIDCGLLPLIVDLIIDKYDKHARGVKKWEIFAIHVEYVSCMALYVEYVID